jgi:hypothetical protein
MSKKICDFRFAICDLERLGAPDKIPPASHQLVFGLKDVQVEDDSARVLSQIANRKSKF